MFGGDRHDREPAAFLYQRQLLQLTLLLEITQPQHALEGLHELDVDGTPRILFLRGLGVVIVALGVQCSGVRVG